MIFQTYFIPVLVGDIVAETVHCAEGIEGAKAPWGSQDIPHRSANNPTIDNLCSFPSLKSSVSEGADDVVGCFRSSIIEIYLLEVCLNYPGNYLGPKRITVPSLQFPKTTRDVSNERRAIPYRNLGVGAVMPIDLTR